MNRNLWETAIALLEEFNKWLEEMQKKYSMDKNDIQEFIKEMLK